MVFKDFCLGDEGGLSNLIDLQMVVHAPLGNLNVILKCNFQSFFTDWLVSY